MTKAMQIRFSFLMYQILSPFIGITGKIFVAFEKLLTIDTLLDCCCHIIGDSLP